MDAGVFHDAHEVYAIHTDGTEYWIATFKAKSLADWYVESLPTGARIDVDRFEVRPV